MMNWLRYWSLRLRYSKDNIAIRQMVFLWEMGRHNLDFRSVERAAKYVEEKV